ncbi:MAG: ATP-dependent DNA ligase [Vulcanimicrobiaceae bacterium]
MIAFAQICDAIAATGAKSAKIERLAEYFRGLGEADLRATARFLSGDPLAAHDDRKIAIGGRTILTAARRAWDVDERALPAAYRQTGDLGEALGRLFREPRDVPLFGETLAPSTLAELLDEAASAAGPSAGRLRERICERALRACREPREAVYVIKVLTGELRIGLREGLLVEALAAAFERDVQSVRRAAMAAGDVGAVALAARSGELEAIAVHYGAPIGFMLASPIAYGSSYRELATGTWQVEDKYDGVRAQAHKRGADVRIFSRTFNELSRSFPELAAALAACRGDFILDGEIVAQREGRVLPFRYLQPRLQRVDPSPELRADVPAVFVVFDVLAAGDRFLLDASLAERRRALEAEVVESPGLQLAPWQPLEEGASAETVAAAFEAARARGHEGLMLKRSDAPYVPGRRGKWWLKLKRELSTLDVVVVGVEWGHGKRKNVLSDYTFAVRKAPDAGELLVIGKAYSGLTDAEIAELTAWFLEHRTGMLSSHAFAVAPQIVIEVAFDVIQKSSLHSSGYALRFPRIARLRPDKPASEIDTLHEVERIYREMLEREGVAE